jgi:hypothetical protein
LAAEKLTGAYYSKCHFSTSLYLGIKRGERFWAQMNTNEKLEEIARLLAEVKAELADQARQTTKPKLDKDGTMFISNAYVSKHREDEPPKKK